MNVYEKCKMDKNLAAKVLLPLIEFEFGLVGDDSPTLVQAGSNSAQLKAIFDICKRHKWTKFEEPKVKRDTIYFRMTNEGLSEIHNIAGPFIDEMRNKWTKLITERIGKKGGYMKETPSTEKKILQLMSGGQKIIKVGDVCLKLRLTPSTVRKSFRKLSQSGIVRRERVGRSITWELNKKTTLMKK